MLKLPQLFYLIILTVLVYSCKKSDNSTTNTAPFEATINGARWLPDTVVTTREPGYNSPYFKVIAYTLNQDAAIWLTTDVDAVTQLTFRTNPANLIKFSGRNTGAFKVLLEWTTATEMNLNVFEVERSSDGINWSKISLINATGGSVATNYSFLDMNAPKIFKAYYRLRMLDKDGRSQLSHVLSVTTGSPCMYVTIINGSTKFLAANHGSLKVTHVDTINKKISGTFSFTYIQDSTTIGTVTNGRFTDLPYR